MSKLFTIEEIEKAIRLSPKHDVFIMRDASCDDGFSGNIMTIEIEMFLFRLFDSNKIEYDKYKTQKNNEMITTQENCTTSVLDIIKNIPQQAQVQYSLQQQLRELRIAANKLGLYDAADFISPHFLM